MNRSKEYSRDMSRRKALRKKRITEEIYWDGFGPNYHPYYDNLHQYSKNKIHCSCHICSAKSKNKGRRRNLSGNYSPSENWAVKDQKRIEAMRQQLEEQLKK